MTDQPSAPASRRSKRVALVAALGIAVAAIAGGAFALRHREVSRKSVDFVDRCSAGCQTSGATQESCATLCGCMVERLRATGPVVDLGQYYESRARGVPTDPAIQQRVNAAQTECLSPARAAR
jgi:hypothetical protein